MKKSFLVLLLIFSTSAFAQRDSLNLGDRYFEDQLYFGLTFNQLYNQPTDVVGSGFSYGVNFGYLKDVPLNKKGSFSLALGLGYSFDSFNHGFKLSSVDDVVVFDVIANISSNSFKTHFLEVPFEVRWRTSTANKYKFWRIYTGIKFGYNLKNSFSYDNTTYNNVERFDKFQYGLTLSAGYSTFNFNLYYGLKPLFKDATSGEPTIGTKVLRMGIIFYIL